MKRRSDGPDLDLDAALDAAIALRADDLPDERVFRTMQRRKRDLSVMILLDVSESTRDRVLPSGASVLDIERLAVAALAEALAALNDPFALRAFASAGREDVRMYGLKDFGEPYGPAVKARLAHLEPHLSTRLGTVLRHAGAEMASVRSHRKLILVLTDGEPSDIDVVDPRDLIEDARRAVLGLRSRGIDVFGVTLDPSGAGSGAAVFGRGSICPCGAWKICHRASPSSISVSRGVENYFPDYFRLRAGGAPIRASKTIANAASSPCASTPPLAARIRPPIPASFGSCEMPAVQPRAARQLSRISGSQRSEPCPNQQRTNGTERSERRSRPGHQFAGDRTTMRQKNSALGVTDDDDVVVAIERRPSPSGS